MTRLLINYVSREKSGNALRISLSNLSASVGIICNILLCVIKFTLGSLTGAVSVTADAVNNLSDCASNVVTLTGTKLSSKSDDKEHPFGHGRIEYISALIVAVSIFVVSFELLKGSVVKILHPQTIRYAPWYIALLVFTVLVKIWMAYFNSKLFKLTDNLNLKGVKQDSINDSVVTFATVVSVVLSDILGIRALDGIIGVVISVFIFISGVNILKEVLSPLIGEAPPKDIASRIEQIILKSDTVLGVHDLIIHNYGAGKFLASADAEVDASEDIFTIHGAIDSAERRIYDELGVEICIHMDPVDTSDGESIRLKKKAESMIKKYNPSFSLHDFRLTEREGERYINFDLIIPFDEEQNRQRIEAELTSVFKEKMPLFQLDINIEHPYIQ